MTRNEHKTLFSKTLYRIRSAGGKSQEQMAELMNISRKTVARWENGEAQPSCEEALYWCKCAGVPAEYYLFTMKYGAYTPDLPEEACRSQVLEYFRSCPVEECRKMLFLIRGEHGSIWSCLLDLFVMHVHLSMISRVMGCASVLEKYILERQLGRLVCANQALPNVENIRKALRAATQAVLGGELGYTSEEVGKIENEAAE